ncbi:Bug family tripartite tricarboxylate transporter substrate binding protein [Propylenella binzhouense]|uniref:Bug family tripartite tricarboxylate transporter substrate binding protein n=1 Tax=Propylenella binzhouense TaxID=2555902 RepID=UPI00136FD7DA|nr:tripartite tricarboxylate transporter substrate binding protein [Propylenella binzhouense]
MKSSLGLIAALVLSGSALAQGAGDFPNKPVTLVVAFSPGGSTDNLARVIVDDFGQVLGQPVVVENRPGAGGYVAWRSVQSAPPDGYTVLLAENAVALGKALRPDEPLDPRKAFEAVAKIGTAPMALIINSKLEPKTFQEFVEFAKAKEGGVNFSSSGVGSVSHMTFDALADLIGVQPQHIPYRGGGEANAAVVGGHVDAMMQSVGSARKLSEEGGVRVLAVTSEERNPTMPDVPTLKELGVEPDVELRFWWGIFVPAGTPAPIKEKLAAAMKETLERPAVRDRLANIEVAPEFGPAEEMAASLDSEITNWSALVEKRGIKAD